MALARAIVFEPRIVLMDEPLSALDKGPARHMQIELRACRRLSMTTVYVTHDQREAITMSDRIADGTADASNSSIDRKPSTPRRRRLAGFISRSNFIPVECRNGSGLVRGPEIHTAAPAPAGQHDGGAAGLRLLANAEPQSGVNVLDATLSDIIYQGDSFVCYAVLRDGRQLTLRDYCRSDVLARMPAPGQPISLGLDAQDTILVASDG